jgi:acetoin utilization protein AcuB
MIGIKTEKARRLTLDADTAAELMTPNPLSLRDDATVEEAVRFLTDKGFSAAPVIDDTGRPVGVLSRADILVHDREKDRALSPVPEYFAKSDLAINLGEPALAAMLPRRDRTLVRDIMTPVVFSVGPTASPGRVVQDMVAWKVHRLFVVDPEGVLVGVISALDVLRSLRP